MRKQNIIIICYIISWNYKLVGSSPNKEDLKQKLAKQQENLKQWNEYQNAIIQDRFKKQEELNKQRKEYNSKSKEKQSVSPKKEPNNKSSHTQHNGGDGYDQIIKKENEKTTNLLQQHNNNNQKEIQKHEEKEAHLKKIVHNKQEEEEEKKLMQKLENEVKQEKTHHTGNPHQSTSPKKEQQKKIEEKTYKKAEENENLPKKPINNHGQNVSSEIKVEHNHIPAATKKNIAISQINANSNNLKEHLSNSKEKTSKISQNIKLTNGPSKKEVEEALKQSKIKIEHNKATSSHVVSQNPQSSHVAPQKQNSQSSHVDHDEDSILPKSGTKIKVEPQDTENHSSSPLIRPQEHYEEPQHQVHTTSTTSPIKDILSGGVLIVALLFNLAATITTMVYSTHTLTFNSSVTAPNNLDIFLKEASLSLAGGIVAVLYNTLLLVFCILGYIPKLKIKASIHKILNFSKYFVLFTIPIFIIFLLICTFDGSNDVNYVVTPIINNGKTLIDVALINYPSNCFTCGVTGSVSNMVSWNRVIENILQIKTALNECNSKYGTFFDVASLSTSMYFLNMFLLFPLSYMLILINYPIQWHIFTKDESENVMDEEPTINQQLIPEHEENEEH